MKILCNWTLSFQHDKPLRNLSNKRGQKMHDQGKVEKTVFWLMVVGVARDNIKWNTGSRWQAWQQQELQLSTHIDLEDEREIVNYKWSSPFILSKPALYPLQYLLQQDHAPYLLSDSTTTWSPISPMPKIMNISSNVLESPLKPRIRFPAWGNVHIWPLAFPQSSFSGLSGCTFSGISHSYSQNSKMKIPWLFRCCILDDSKVSTMWMTLLRLATSWEWTMLF